MDAEEVGRAASDRPRAAEDVAGGGASPGVVEVLFSGSGSGGRVGDAVSTHGHEPHPCGSGARLIHTVVAGRHQVEVT